MRLIHSPIRVGSGRESYTDRDADAGHLRRMDERAGKVLRKQHPAVHRVDDQPGALGRAKQRPGIRERVGQRSHLAPAPPGGVRSESRPVVDDQLVIASKPNSVCDREVDRFLVRLWTQAE